MDLLFVLSGLFLVSGIVLYFSRKSNPAAVAALVSIILSAVLMYGMSSAISSPAVESAGESVAEPAKDEALDVASRVSDPDYACSALESVDLPTRAWTNHYEGEYGCSSNYRDIGSGRPMPNNIAFYVEGSASKARLAKLVININDTSEKGGAHAELTKASKVLLKRFADADMSAEVSEAITKGHNYSASLNGKQLTIKRIDWSNGRGGYGVKVTLEW